MEISSDSASDSASSSVDSSESGDIGFSSCNFACIQVMRPVVDPETGKTYSNECMMRLAKCKGKGKKDTNPLEEYKRIYGKPFGAPREDDSGDDSASEEDDSSTADDGSEEDNDSFCPDACLDVMRPVTDKDGKTYSNECYMKAAKCKETSASGDESTDGTPKSYCPNILCPAVYQPVTDENGVMYSNKCAMEAAKCKGPRENPLDDKKCAGGCPDVILPVCGSDGIKYSNPCELKIAACKNPGQNIVEDDSACSKTSRDDRLIRTSTGKIGTMDM
ncbi:Kazal-type serine protease inhibitor [Phytophthora megakarya]|uniref:Kazal-type serine protease inhibitor n=1 Tax=Phytophthora megakarya TaxID=4795 RepID=A0A225X2P7_9STRA|nr:Kazal-type serine protease inhibitor [Phytophthora megakarya]